MDINTLGQPGVLSFVCDIVYVTATITRLTTLEDIFNIIKGMF